MSINHSKITLHKLTGPLSVVLILLLLYACQRDDYYENNDVILRFSVDTLRFDTVFTSVGSATRSVKIFNPKSQAVLVDVTLENQVNSYFRFNADGLKGPTAQRIEIGGGDSIYIFVETTINPDLPLSVSPFIIEDKLWVDVNGERQVIYLEAFGQNANYIPAIGKGISALLSCNSNTVIWNDPKPYVIYGILYIDSCHLVIPAGTKIYVHGGIVRQDSFVYNEGLIVFLKNGRLTTQGTEDQPVIFQGDRLETAFADQRGQWVGLLFFEESKNHLLRHTVIKNSIIGVRVDSLASLRMESCRIFNTSNTAIIARHSTIYAENCLMYDNGGNGLQLTFGGNYTFNYCTVASYSGQREAVFVSDFYCRDIFCSGGRLLNPLKASFTNCIFAGNDKDEITLLRAGPAGHFQYAFNHCAVRVLDILKPNDTPDFFDYCNMCINLKGTEKLFNNRNKSDYSLDTMSVALQKAVFMPGINLDITGKMRKSDNPDLGCFEL